MTADAALSSRTILRSPLGRVRGLGSAKSGTGHWWAQRLTALALLPLTIWFVLSVIGLAGAPHAAVLAWVAAPLNTVLLLLLIVATFHHMQLGLQVVIEDYVHGDWARVGTLLAMKAITIVLGTAAAVAVLRVAL